MTTWVAVPKLRANRAEKTQFLLKHVSSTLHWAPFVWHSADNMLKVCTALTRQNATETAELIRPQNARPHFSIICFNWNPSVTDHKHLKG